MIRQKPDHQLRHTVAAEVLGCAAQGFQGVFAPLPHIPRGCENTLFPDGLGGGTVWISYNLADGAAGSSQFSKEAQGQSSGVPISGLSRKVQSRKVMRTSSG